MSWVAVAIGGSALLGAYTANQSAKTQAGAADNASQATLEQYYQNRSDLAPYRNAGNSALQALMLRLGLSPSTGPGSGTGPDWDAYLKANPDVAASSVYGDNPQGHYNDYGKKEGRLLPMMSPSTASSDPAFGSLLKNFSTEDFQTDPGYEFRLAEGEKALNRASAARGSWDSGASLKALERYGQDYASGEYQNAYQRYVTDQTNQFNRLSGIAGTGQTAATSGAQLGTQATGQANDYLLSGAAARGAGAVGVANAVAGGVGQGVNLYNTNRLLDAYLKK